MNWQESFQDILKFEPFGRGINVFAILVLFGIVLATYVVAWLVRRLLDRRLSRMDTEARFSLERMAQLVIWVIGLLVALGWISLKVESLEKGLASYHLFDLGGHPITPQSILLFALMLLLTAYASRLAGRLGHFGLFQRLEHGPRYTVIRLIQYAVWVVGVMLGLKMVNIDLTALAVVAGALGLGIGFGLQNVVANFVAGLVLLFERPIKVSDFVSTDDVEGRVQEIRFRSTVIQTNDNIAMILPNSELTGRALINWSHFDPKVRLHIKVGVAYGSDVQLVTRALLEVAAENSTVLEKPEPQVWFREFGDSSLNFELLVWTEDPVQHNRLRSQMHYGIDAAFRKYKIQIPFPQRDLHVRTAAGLRELVKSTEDAE